MGRQIWNDLDASLLKAENKKSSKRIKTDLSAYPRVGASLGSLKVVNLEHTWWN